MGLQDNSLEDPDKKPIHRSTLRTQHDTAADDIDEYDQTRPIPGDLIASHRHIVAGIATHCGVTRANNQDAVFSFVASHGENSGVTSFGIFAVADGMGGYFSGEKAAAIAVRTVATRLLDQIYLPSVTDTSTLFEHATLDSILRQTIAEVDHQIRSELPDSGTTLTLALVYADTITIAHIGDSRAYWIAPNSSAQRVTRDHTKVQRLVELGQISEDEAERHTERNQLYRALGRGKEELIADIERRRLIPGSFLLLCTDGLWNMIRSEELTEIIIHSITPQDACEKLIARANMYGGSDNVSAVIAHIPSS
jgi:PPM family protein phosphatase